jgi:hypothetical protein
VLLVAAGLDAQPADDHHNRALEAAHQRDLLAHQQALDLWNNLVLSHRCGGVFLPGGPIIALNRLHVALLAQARSMLPPVPVTEAPRPATGGRVQSRGTKVAATVAAGCGALLWLLMIGSAQASQAQAQAAAARTAALPMGSSNGFLHVCTQDHWNNGTACPPDGSAQLVWQHSASPTAGQAHGARARIACLSTGRRDRVNNQLSWVTIPPPRQSVRRVDARGGQSPAWLGRRRCSGCRR